MAVAERRPRLVATASPATLPAVWPGTTLQALSRAAFALPLLAPMAHAADEGQVHFQYGRYQEGERDLGGIQSAYGPLEVDFLQAGASGTLFDRFSFSFDYVQDTWSGATPISTAPVQLRGNRPTDPDGVSGATPFLDGELFLDADFNVLATDGFGNLTGEVDNELVHTIAGASPETRRQVELGLGYDWSRAELRVGGGVSSEPDYLSGFVELGGSLGFDRRNTIVDLETSYTHSDIDATLDHDAAPYVDTRAFDDRIGIDDVGNRRLNGTRRDLTALLDVTRTLDERTLVSTSVRYQYSHGYLSNPYKVVEVAFIDPDQQFLAPPGGYYANVFALLEQRPSHRNQLSLATRLVRHLDWTGASLHLGYAFGWDDWDIRSHTFDLEIGQPLPWGFTFTPRLRYYSQSEADFYVPYLVSQQAYRTVSVGPGGLEVTPYDPDLLPNHFSSDYRLSGFGSLAVGATLAKQLEPGVRLALSFEYYRHEGDYKLGGGGEASFADYDAWTFSGVLQVDLAALSLARGRAQQLAHHAGAAAPQGLMGAHLLPEPGFMIGYRIVYGIRDGDMGRGTRAFVGDAELVDRACRPSPCGKTPSKMEVFRNVVELMYAPTSWLTLAVMPQYVDTEMKLRQLDGGIVDDHTPHQHHASGGFGDLRLNALLRAWSLPGHELRVGLGLSAPTGSVDEKFRRSHQESRGLLPYGMQLGSGTWDLLPGLSYAGRHRDLSWGAQLGGVVRLEHENDSGYALGDVFDATVWGGYALWPWLAGSLRGAYRIEGGIRGSYDAPHPVTSPTDHAGNYGGQFADVGIGLRATVPTGFFAGQSIGIEWLQPIWTDWKGYQLDRTGVLSAGWSMHF